MSARRFAVIFYPVIFLAAPRPAGAETWQMALSRMPLMAPVAQLNRSNCVGLLLGAFRSNDLVKALIFMPGATDEFYLFKRAEARLTNNSPSLLDAVAALTNQTLIRATFRPPLLLLHTDEDPLEPDVSVRDAPTQEKTKRIRLPALCFNDRDWESVQPVLKWSLKMDIRPWQHSADSWHFYRHSFCAWNLTGWEALQAACLAGKSKFTVLHGRIIFQPDPRIRATPVFEVPDPHNPVQLHTEQPR